jgi:hypothetical protein
MNMVAGKIVHSIPGLMSVRVTIDLGGMELYAIIPELLNFRLYERVWVCFT